GGAVALTARQKDQLFQVFVQANRNIAANGGAGAEALLRELWRVFLLPDAERDTLVRAWIATYRADRQGVLDSFDLESAASKQSIVTDIAAADALATDLPPL
ncbi:MAG: hypothetical protein L0206_20260, partial [Actinobacteria bacterium]|nr:hypothetical protein [Actinomycetota bacterium]